MLFTDLMPTYLSYFYAHSSLLLHVYMCLQAKKLQQRSRKEICIFTLPCLVLSNSHQYST